MDENFRTVIGAALISSGIGGVGITAFTQTAAAGVPQECEELPGMNDDLNFVSIVQAI